MMEPVKPDNSDCCGSGCTPCVFDVYEAELQKWRDGASVVRSQEQRFDLLSSMQYRPYRIVNTVEIAQDIFLFRFQASTSSQNGSDAEGNDAIPGFLPFKPSQHLIMRFPRPMSAQSSTSIANEKSPSNVVTPEGTEAESKFISRAYTPISLANKERDCCFDAFIKLYEGGAMSAVLRHLRRGDLVYFRGPYGGFEHTPGSYSSLTMVCAGTGLAPMISIIKSILNNEDDETLVLLLFSVSNFRSIILRDEIRNFCRNWNVKAKIFLSAEQDWNEVFPQLRHDEVILCQRISQKVIEAEVCSRQNNQVLLCGPDGFCRAVEGWLRHAKFDVEQRLFVF